MTLVLPRENTLKQIEYVSFQGVCSLAAYPTNSYRPEPLNSVGYSNIVRYFVWSFAAYIR